MYFSYVHYAKEPIEKLPVSGPVAGCPVGILANKVPFINEYIHFIV